MNLFKIIDENNTDLFEKILKSHFITKNKLKDGHDIFSYSVINDKESFIQLIIKYQPDIINNDSRKFNLLSYLINNQDLKKLKKFVNLGLSVYSLDKNKDNWLSQALNNNSSDEILSFIIKKSPKKLLNSFNKNNINSLLIATDKGKINVISELLNKKVDYYKSGLYFDKNNNREINISKSPLQIAVEKNFTDIVDIILSYSKEPHELMADEFHRTSTPILYIACEKKNFDIIDLFMKYGFSRTGEDLYCKLSYYPNFLHCLSRFEDDEVPFYLIYKHDFDPYFSNNITPKFSNLYEVKKGKFEDNYHIYKVTQEKRALDITIGNREISQLNKKKRI